MDMSETLWPEKPVIFAWWPFTEKVWDSSMHVLNT